MGSRPSADLASCVTQTKLRPIRGSFSCLIQKIRILGQEDGLDCGVLAMQPRDLSLIPRACFLKKDKSRCSVCPPVVPAMEGDSGILRTPWPAILTGNRLKDTTRSRPREMARWFRAPADRAENSHLVPSTHTVTYCEGQC